MWFSMNTVLSITTNHKPPKRKKKKIVDTCSVSICNFVLLYLVFFVLFSFVASDSEPNSHTNTKMGLNKKNGISSQNSICD